jgi:hypothetical protein
MFENPVKQRGLAVSAVRVKQDILSGAKKPEKV